MYLCEWAWIACVALSAHKDWFFRFFAFPLLQSQFLFGDSHANYFWFSTTSRVLQHTHNCNSDDINLTRKYRKLERVWTSVNIHLESAWSNSKKKWTTTTAEEKRRKNKYKMHRCMKGRSCSVSCHLCARLQNPTFSLILDACIQVYVFVCRRISHLLSRHFRRRDRYGYQNQGIIFFHLCLCLSLSLFSFANIHKGQLYLHKCVYASILE